MRMFRILPALLLLGCTQAQPAAPAPSPEEEQARIMDRIEALVRLPEGARPLAEYGRHYAWQSRWDGARKVVAIYVEGESPGRRWVAENRLPLVMDGGCGIVNLSFDVATGRIEGVSCNGDG